MIHLAKNGNGHAAACGSTGDKFGLLTTLNIDDVRCIHCLSAERDRRHPRAVVVIAEGDDGALDLKVEFFPDASRDGENPLTHHAAMVATQAIRSWCEDPESAQEGETHV